MASNRGAEQDAETPTRPDSNRVNQNFRYQLRCNPNATPAALPGQAWVSDRRDTWQQRWERKIPAISLCGTWMWLAEDVFDFVEEGGGALDGLVFDFDDAMQLLEEGFLLLRQF